MPGPTPATTAKGEGDIVLEDSLEGVVVVLGEALVLEEGLEGMGFRLMIYHHAGFTGFYVACLTIHCNGGA